MSHITFLQIEKLWRGHNNFILEIFFFVNLPSDSILKLFSILHMNLNFTHGHGLEKIGKSWTWPNFHFNVLDPINIGVVQENAYLSPTHVYNPLLKCQMPNGITMVARLSTEIVRVSRTEDSRLKVILSLPCGNLEGNLEKLSAPLQSTKSLLTRPTIGV